MRFEPKLAAARFGYGAALRQPLPERAEDMVAEARAPDAHAALYPLLTTAEMVETQETFRATRRAMNRAENDTVKAAKRRELEALEDVTRYWTLDDFRATLIRQIEQPTGVRERLVAFWEDHFTARAAGPVIGSATAVLSNDAVRPHVTGRFADMLKAVVRSPIMLLYLDQAGSLGPNSRRVRQSGKRGMNENLARELLELHTLGVDGPYSQQDVRELAELLTGLTLKRGEGFVFREDFAEPGGETVLGKIYGGRGRPDGLVAIDAALDDLALHPVTARHLATKLAVHFVSETAERALVDDLAATYLDSGGDLGAVTELLLTHPLAHAPELRNVKLPMEFFASVLRALGVEAEALTVLEPKRVQQMFTGQMLRMGQRWRVPRDPAGLPEEDDFWITPSALATRVNWSMRVPEQLVDRLPDPRELLTRVIADPPKELVFAVGAAEARPEGVGIVFASPSFQRR